MRDSASDYRKLIATLPSVEPGRLYATIRQAFEYKTDKSVQQLINRLRLQGYDLAQYEAEVCKRYKTERRKGNLVKALEAAALKRLEKTPAKKAPAKKTSAKKEPELPSIREELPSIRPHETPTHVAKRRQEWLREMLVVSGWTNPASLLAVAWQTDTKTVQSRIDVLRKTGHDLSFWKEDVTCPGVEPTKSESKVARSSISTTVFALSEIAGVSYEIADKIAETIGVPSFSGFCPVRGCSISARGPLSVEQASRILSHLGFVRRSRLAQEFPIWEIS